MAEERKSRNPGLPPYRGGSLTDPCPSYQPSEIGAPRASQPSQRTAPKRPADHEEQVALPRITLPWSALCPDNRKSGVIDGQILLTRRYRATKRAARTLALQQMQSGHCAAIAGPCVLLAMLYPPDKRRRDAVNLAKSLHDALEGVCYADDAQLTDVRYVRGPVDRTNPRVEVTISPLSPISEVHRP